MKIPQRQIIRLRSIRDLKKLLVYPNKVLARTFFKVEEQKTQSGIILISDTDWEPAMHANRVSEVVMVPDRLHFTRSKRALQSGETESMPWDCEMQLKPGDIIWHDFLDGLNCPIIKTEEEPDEEYRLLNYPDIYVAKRSVKALPDYAKAHDDICISPVETISYICLNGYNLCEEITEAESLKIRGESVSEFDYRNLSNSIDRQFGRVAFIAYPNMQYMNKKYSDDGVDISVGDIIIKRRSDIHILLEDKYHTIFDTGKSYFIIQRKDIYAKISNSNNS